MGRPKADIDPKAIFALVSNGCKITEIADTFGVNIDTITTRFPEEIAKGRANLRTSLRKHQIRAAEQGNSTMLVWLGKQYLGQSDTTIDDYLLQALKTANLSKEDLLEMIKNKDRANALRPKVSFHDFCLKSDYPPPYEKQLEIMKFIMAETEPRLLLGARGYGKTDYGVIMGLAYEMYLDPTSQSTLIITKSKSRNASIIAEIERAASRAGVSFEKHNSEELRAFGFVGKDHNVSAVTIGTNSLRGRHPKRIIMDDPVTEDDTSEATRLRARRVLNEAMKLCQNIALIGQPAHQYDLYADVRGKIKTLEIPFGSIAPLDHDLAAQRIAGVSEASISASYYLKILTEGTSPFDKVNYIDFFPQGDSVAFMDPSEGGDYTAVTILKMHMNGVAVVGFVYRKAWNHTLDDLVPKFIKYGVRRLAFETNSTGNMPIQMLRQMFPGLGVVGRRANNNKHSRIMAAGAYAHLIHLSKESDKLYLDHVVKYEYKSKFDDAPDSLASCLEWINLIRGKQ